MLKSNFQLISRFLILVSILFLPFSGYSQNSDIGNWLIYIGSKQVNQKWNIHHEVQYRNYDLGGDLEQLLLRTGLGYNIDDSNTNFLLGYGFILSENYTGNDNEKVSVNEHRIFQQFISKQNIRSVKISHRYRFEQRFVEEDFRMRFRYFLSLNVPLNKNTEHSLYLSAYNEIFLNSESSVFDRNRLYGGLGYKLCKSAKLELGYMNQFFERSSRDQINIVALVNF
ncbi:MAG: DUF2490 domain-containing protein [Bacteroidia bacterium]|nr:DUF2490 domain-containing protein [Bacteroidia bacterium]